MRWVRFDSDGGGIEGVWVGGAGILLEARVEPLERMGWPGGSFVSLLPCFASPSWRARCREQDVWRWRGRVELLVSWRYYEILRLGGGLDGCVILLALGARCEVVVCARLLIFNCGSCCIPLVRLGRNNASISFAIVDAGMHTEYLSNSSQIATLLVRAAIFSFTPIQS
jgi:hypothetical protein